MHVLVQVAPAVGCALMMVVCLVSMGGVRTWRRWRAREALGHAPLVDPVEGWRREIESLKQALNARDRSGSQS